MSNDMTPPTGARLTWDEIVRETEEESGSDQRLVSLCESCRFMQPDFPTMEDPLASPFCTKGHWSGYIVEAPPEDDPWKDCPDFEANGRAESAGGGHQPEESTNSNKSKK